MRVARQKQDRDLDKHEKHDDGGMKGPDAAQALDHETRELAAVGKSGARM